MNKKLQLRLQITAVALGVGLALGLGAVPASAASLSSAVETGVAEPFANCVEIANPVFGLTSFPNIFESSNLFGITPLGCASGMERRQTIGGFYYAVWTTGICTVAFCQNSPCGVLCTDGRRQCFSPV
jgi:hypothetical protein